MFESSLSIIHNSLTKVNHLAEHISNYALCMAEIQKRVALSDQECYNEKKVNIGKILRRCGRRPSVEFTARQMTMIKEVIQWLRSLIP